MTRYIKEIIFIVTLLAGTGVASAVTDKEMEEARTIAAKTYLRYANNGSGYLDEVKASTLADLEKQLKGVEKENLKPFKAIPLPSGYQSWDKAKLIEFWAGTVFENTTLNEKGRTEGKTPAKRNLQAMTVAASAAEPVQQEEKPATEEQQPLQTPQEVTAEPEAVPMQQEGNLLPDDLLSTETAIEEDIQNEEEDEMVEPKKAEDNTWVYIMALSILVALVIGLMVFSLNILKKGKSKRQAGESAPVAENADAASIKDLNRQLAEKEETIEYLSRKLEETTRRNEEMKVKIESLVEEINILNKAKAENVSRVMQSEKPVHAEHNESVKPAASHPVRTIYLGRVNARGIFVRADRNLNPENTVYRLDTKDGYTGNFRVVSDQRVWDRVLDKPVEYLSHGCITQDLEDTDGVEKIVTEQSGNAIFKDGCWQVIKKTKIRYE